MKSKLKPVVHQTKTQALRDQLAQLVATMQPDERLPTMRQLQESLQVSPMTLHRALSELEAQSVIYRRQGSGTYVAPRVAELQAEKTTQHTVGLVYERDVFGSNASPFGAMLLEEASRRARAHDERFSLYLAASSNEAMPVHDDLRDAVEQGRVRGVLYAGESNPQALHWLQQHNVPVVTLSYLPTSRYRVKIDHAQIARLGVKSLAARGCKRIGLWIPLGVGIGRAESETSFPELDAFKAALKKHNLEYFPELVWREAEHTNRVHTQPRETNQEQGIRAAQEVFGARSSANSLPLRPDGLVIDDDMMTRGALTVFSRLGLQLGTTLHVATHTNKGSTVLTGHEDELSLLEIDPAAIAAAMLDILESLMRGETPARTIFEIKPKLRT